MPSQSTEAGSSEGSSVVHGSSTQLNTTQQASATAFHARTHLCYCCLQCNSIQSGIAIRKKRVLQSNSKIQHCSCTALRHRIPTWHDVWNQKFRGTCTQPRTAPSNVGTPTHGAHASSKCEGTNTSAWHNKCHPMIDHDPSNAGRTHRESLDSRYNSSLAGTRSLNRWNCLGDNSFRRCMCTPLRAKRSQVSFEQGTRTVKAPGNMPHRTVTTRRSMQRARWKNIAATAREFK